MDRNELREQLRKKTARPAQPDKVKELWKNIETEAELNTRQKLEKLLALSRKKKPEKKAGSGQDINRSSSSPARQPYLVLENNFNLSSSYGQIPISLGLNIPGRCFIFSAGMKLSRLFHWPGPFLLIWKPPGWLEELALYLSSLAWAFLISRGSRLSSFS